MRISKFVGMFLAIALCFSAASIAQAESLKIATISIQQVLEKSTAGQEARKVLAAKRSELQPKFQAEQQALQEQAKEIEKKSSVWSPEVRGKKEREYQKKMREYQLRAEDAQYELKQLEQKVLNPFFKELQDVISDVSKKKGYSIVFEKSNSGGMVYADPALDISDDIVKAMNEKLAK